MPSLLARESEKQLLDRIWRSKHPEFLAIYGRLRVGKTFLVREYCQQKGIYIEVTGRKDGNLQTQLQSFIDGFAETFSPELPLQAPKNWHDAFNLLTKKIKTLPPSKKIWIFLDELPWLATKRSGLMQELDYFWNRHWSQLNNIRLIVCGSAAQWMLSKLVNAKGGLHNRLTHTLLLEPFNLNATQNFLLSQGLKYNHKQILQLYMVTGGVAHYLKQVKKGKSAAQNINMMCFNKNGFLFNEFEKLYASLFDNLDIKLKIIRALNKHPSGQSRNDLLKILKLPSSGFITNQLKELVSAGFIQRFIPHDKKNKDQHYRIIDEYTLFYLQWIEPAVQTQTLANIDDYWQRQINTPKYHTWTGYAFENVCYKHIRSIANKLDLNGFSYEVGTWQNTAKTPSDQGVQIDLLFDRKDGVTTICEIKYSEKQFVIDKKTAGNLANKLIVYGKAHPEKQLLLTLITASGLKKNFWSEDLVDNSIMLEDLFADR